MASRRTVMRTLKTEQKSVMAAYIQAIREKNISINELENLIEQNDVNGIVELIELTESDVAGFIERLRETAVVGGNLEKGINPNTASAMDWLQTTSGRFITETNHHKPLIVQELLAANAALGRNPRATALDLVGRVGITGKREGGFIGLNLPQVQAVNNARNNLSSGDPELMRKYFNNTRRDHRFDKQVQAYIDRGQPLPQDLLNKVTTRYEARLLQTRGETIARTETIEALNFGRQESMSQYADQIDDDAEIIKIWVSGPDDGRQRETHTEANGKEAKMNEPFIVGGERLMFPSDTSLGASAEEVINCRCTVAYSIRKKELA